MISSLLLCTDSLRAGAMDHKTAILSDAMQAEGLGTPTRQVALWPEPARFARRSAPHVLVTSERGVFLLHLRGRHIERALSLSLRAVTVTAQKRGDRLCLSRHPSDGPRWPERQFWVSPAERKGFRRFMIDWRWPPGAVAEEWPAAGHHFWDPPPVSIARWFAAHGRVDEVPLVHLRLARPRDAGSSDAQLGSSPHLLVTSSRTLWITASPFGEVALEENAPSAGAVSPRFGAKVPATPPARAIDLGPWASPAVDPRLAKLEPLFAVSGHPRIGVLAQLLWREERGQARRQRAVGALLRAGHRHRQPEATLLLAALQDSLGSPAPDIPSASSVQEALHRVVELRHSSAGLGRDWRIFELSAHVAEQWLAEWKRAGPPAWRWALPFHALYCAHEKDRGVSTREAAWLDVGYLQHLIDLRRFEEALELWELRYAALPSPLLSEILPATDDDVEAGPSYRTLRLTMLRQRVDIEAGQPHAPCVTPWVQLAQLDPWSVSNLHQLAYVTKGERAERVQDVIRLFSRGDVAPRRANARPHVSTRTLTTEELDDALRHPEQRRRDPTRWLHRWMGQMALPDPNALRNFCERFPVDSPLEEMVQDVCALLDMPSVVGYVSRGRKSIGIRAFSREVPVLVVGGCHLSAESPYAMTSTELGFAIAAEIAHLRFGHVRMTPQELWAGARAKGRLGTEVLLGLMPALRGIGVVDKLWDLLETYRKGVLGRVVQGVRTAEKVMTEARGPHDFAGHSRTAQPVAPPHEQLIDAHRQMQLTADRAGLLFTRDLKGAVRSMLLSSATYCPMLPAFAAGGLDALRLTPPHVEVAHWAELQLRISALIGFYLSDEYERLSGDGD